MKLYAWAVALIFATSAALAQNVESSAPAPTMALEDGLWFDGSRFVSAQWYAVDGRFTTHRPDRVDVKVDLGGRYVLPPLVEAHNHDMQQPRFAAVSVDKNLRQGVFYSVQMCSKPAERGLFEGLLSKSTSVDVLYTDACISSSDGHPLGIALASAKRAGMNMTIDEARKSYDPIDTKADLDRLWPEILERQPKIIKLILINSEKHADNRKNKKLFGRNGLDPALVEPIVSRAHDANIRVVVHADSAADFTTAVRAGADIIAHLPGYRFAEGMTASDYRIADTVIDEMARRGTAVITTAVAAQYHLKKHPEDAAELKAVQIDNLRRLRAAGVRLAIGSDDVMGTVVNEILYLDELNVMPRAELLRRATMDTARLMFPRRAIGAFEEGREASFVAFDANPLQKLDVLRTPAIRVKQGTLLGN